MPNNDPNGGRFPRRSFLKSGAALMTPFVLSGYVGDDNDRGTTRGSTAGNTNIRQEDDRSRVVVAQETSTGTMDPQDFDGATDRSIIFNSYEKLVTFDFLGDGELIPQLASDWERLEDELLRIFIRDGVEFHNGDPLTSDDAAFSINRVVDDDVDIVTRRPLPNVSHAEVVDGESAIDLHLTEPDPIIESRLAYAGGVMNRSWVEENDHDYVSTNENGTGPYRLVGFDPDFEARFERVSSDEYWNDEVDLEQYPEELVFQASREASTRISQLLTEEVHIITNVIPEEIDTVDNAPHTAIRDTPTDRTMMLVMRYDIEPFSNLSFRRALNHAVDPGVIVDTVLDGIGDPTNQVTPPSWFGHNPDLEENPPYPYDPERAEQLIDESGYAGEEISLTVPQGSYLKDTEVGNAIVGQIDSLSNLSCRIEIVDSTTWADMLAPELENKPAFNLVGFGSAPADASVKIDRWFTCDALESDFSTFCDEDIDELSQQAATTIDPDEREAILQEANRVLVEEKAALVPLYFQGAIYGINTDVLEFTPIPQEEIYYFLMEAL